MLYIAMKMIWVVLLEKEGITAKAIREVVNIQAKLENKKS